jgi:hypothetical protein
MSPPQPLVDPLQAYCYSSRSVPSLQLYLGLIAISQILGVVRFLSCWIKKMILANDDDKRSEDAKLPLSNHNLSLSLLAPKF